MLRLLIVGLLLICQTVPAQCFSTAEWKPLVPSDRLPAEVDVQRGNNNLDLIRFQDRFYFAFRTAPTHFASAKAMLYVLSTSDRRNWRLEFKVHLGSDMREPRFAAMREELFFYFFEAGKNPLGFQPAHMYGCKMDKYGTWTAPQKLDGLDGFVGWRFRTRGETLYMSAYYGRDLYNTGHHGDLRLYLSRDGMHWEPISEDPQTGSTGGEEGEFIFDAAGNLWGTVRLEGAGGMLVFAHRDSLDHWHTYPTRSKYDSALLFRDGKDIFLIARRNLDGEADKATWLPASIRRFYNLSRYSLTRKTTAMWKIDMEERRLVHVMDFPGTGDTAFPAISPLEEGKWWLMNYSSDIHGPKKNWLWGQLGKTLIYETILSRLD